MIEDLKYVKNTYLKMTWILKGGDILIISFIYIG